MVAKDRIAQERPSEDTLSETIIPTAERRQAAKGALAALGLEDGESTDDATRYNG